MGDREWSIATFDRPCLNVLLHKRNAHRSMLPFPAAEDMIVREPGRFRAWLGRLEAARPDVVFAGSLDFRRRHLIMEWLDRSYDRLPPPRQQTWIRKPEAGRF